MESQQEKVLNGILAFTKNCEALKCAPRAAGCSNGKSESVADHSWRLSMMVLLYQRTYFPELDLAKMLSLALIHDLSEAIDGDIPAPIKKSQKPDPTKDLNDFKKTIADLYDTQQEALLADYHEYEAQASREAQVVKALDRLESIIQINQGINPRNFDYMFTLNYGWDLCSIDPHLRNMRELLEKETQIRIDQECQSIESQVMLKLESIKANINKKWAETKNQFLQMLPPASMHWLLNNFALGKLIFKIGAPFIGIYNAFSNF